MWELDNLMRAIYIIIKFGAVYNTVMKKKKKKKRKRKWEVGFAVRDFIGY